MDNSPAQQNPKEETRASRDERSEAKKDFKNIFSITYLLILIILTVVYFLAGKLGLSLAFINASATAVWPPAGIALAALLLSGYRVWPAILIGAFLVNLTTQGTIVSSLGIAGGNTLEGLAGAYLINRFCKGTNVFNEVANVFKFAFFAGFLSTAIAATIGVTILVLGGLAPLASYSAIWLTWWLGDVVGVLIVTPLLVFWLKEPNLKWNGKQLFEGSVLLESIFLTGFMVFGGFLPFFSKNAPVTFLVVPVLIWSALRFGQKETSAAIFFICSIAIFATLRGLGPFAVNSPQNESLLLLQAFMGVITIMILSLSAGISELRNAKRQIAQAQEKLSSVTHFEEEKAKIEKEVAARTLELKVLAEEKESIRRKLEVTAEELRVKAENLAVTAKEKEDIRLKLEVTAEELRVKAENLAVTAKEKEDIRLKLEATAEELRVKAENLAIVAKEKAIVEKKVEEKTLELTTTLENLPIGVYLAKVPNGEAIMLNKAGVEILGREADPKANKDTYAEAYKAVRENGETYPTEELPLNITLATGKAAAKTDIYIDKGTIKTPVHVTSVPIKDSQGNMISAVAVIQDMSADKALERSRDEFFSIASHELRTPLTAIKGNTALIQQYYLEKLNDPTLSEMVNDIHESSVRLIEIVNDFLDVSRLEQGRLQFSPDEFDLSSIIEDTIKSYQVTGSRNKLYVNYERPQTPLPKVFADKNKTRQVIINLVGNGLKFTEEGGITISAIPSSQFVKVSVTDTGRGISSINQQLLFRKFQQAGSSLLIHDTKKGTGLGLYISKLIVEGMGGKITLEKSEEGKGTTFAFLLPISTQELKNAQAALVRKLDINTGLTTSVPDLNSNSGVAKQ